MAGRRTLSWLSFRCAMLPFVVSILFALFIVYFPLEGKINTMASKNSKHQNRFSISNNRQSRAFVTTPQYVKEEKINTAEKGGISEKNTQKVKTTTKKSEKIIDKETNETAKLGVMIDKETNGTAKSEMIDKETNGNAKGKSLIDKATTNTDKEVTTIDKERIQISDKQTDNNNSHETDNNDLENMDMDTIYIENKSYDRFGLMKDGSYTKWRPIHRMINESESTAMPPMPLNIKISQQTPKYINKSRHIFINCGGTFPWSVDLFTSTYPDAEKFYIYTFIMDHSYSIMYKRFKKHFLDTAVCAREMSGKNVDIQSFGSVSQITKQIYSINLADWIKKHTKLHDTVILKMDSEEEKATAEHLVKTGAIEKVDKYYTTSEDADVIKDLTKIFSHTKNVTVNTWDRDGKTYSDIDLMYEKKSPRLGKIKISCSDKSDDLKFALILYSRHASANAVKVLGLLHEFSPEDNIPINVFLPYSFFQANFTDVWKLLKTMEVGLQVEPVINSTDNTKKARNIENDLRNQGISTQNLFNKHDLILQNVLIGGNIDDAAIQNVMEVCNFNYFREGNDVTHLIQRVVTGSTFTIDDTRKIDGEYLMINIDTENAEYLALYMIRRFIPWLLKLSECI